ncbi:MAG: hypothetical protein M1358_00060 [Chloroflexi bacterium]|nr:hypothetical protein [Chloroflexota bacterium]
MEQSEAKDKEVNEGEKKHCCLECGITSDHRVLLACEHHGQADWVCVRCLPMLIHGPH